MKLCDRINQSDQELILFFKTIKHLKNGAGALRNLQAKEEFGPVTHIMQKINSKWIIDENMGVKL